METCDLYECVDSYKKLLSVKYPDFEETFESRYNSEEHKEGCFAEAAVVSFMQYHKYNIEIQENPYDGGVDFCCFSEEDKFVLEVTSLKEDTVARQSGWEKDIPSEGIATSYRMITPIIRTKISSKARQLSGYQFPRILAICSIHYASRAILGEFAARNILVGDPRIAVDLDNPDMIKNVTGLEDTGFIRFDIDSGELESCRKSISAILFVSIACEQVHAIGSLHPDPEIELPIDYLPEVQFLQLINWPPESNVLETEKLRKDVDDYYSPHVKIEIP